MKNKKGFTLVELLIVIAIIGILSTVAVVNLNSARKKAKEAVAKDWIVSLVPAVTLCHDAEGILEPLVLGGPLCTTITDMTWPSILPEGYDINNAGVEDTYPSNGSWSIQIDGGGGGDNLQGYYCYQRGCGEL